MRSGLLKGAHMKKFLAAAGFGVILALLTMFAGGAFADGELSGKVVETMSSGGYTYALIEKGDKKTWIAVPQTKIVKGQTITFLPGVEMGNFQSKTLKRTFDSIIFSAGVAAGPSSQGDSGGSAASKGAVVVPAEKIKVDKASGPDAYTVEEIYKNIEGLDKKKVSLKGKVVKVSTGIMNMTWIHLQDGTGDPKKGSHDLVITTEESAAVGDIVTASGTIAKDKDFGSNYKYKVIMEKASIKK
jgi:hypothetical protein